jgi:hypothetical protein
MPPMSEVDELNSANGMLLAFGVPADGRVLRELAPLEQIAQLPSCEEATLDLADAILEQAGKFATGVLSPLNVSGYAAKLETARCYADHVLARASGLAHTVAHGAESALAIEDDQF